jgi:hypothetical protein
MSVLKTKNKKKYNYNDIDFGFYDEIFCKNKHIENRQSENLKTQEVR